MAHASIQILHERPIEDEAGLRSAQVTEPSK
jgi:hypothetical protein